MRVKRVYHPIHLWEEIRANMWGEVSDKPEMTERAIAFTGDHVSYGSFMMKVVHEWPVSCENAFTDPSLNHKAWVGHAACAMAIGCPEDITRKAWGMLTDEQRFLANKEAERAIRVWWEHYSKNRELCKDLGGQVLFEWDS